MGKLCSLVIAGVLLLCLPVLCQEEAAAPEEELVIDDMEAGAPDRWGEGKCRLQDVRKAGS